MGSRSIQQIIQGIPAEDGAGVKLYRIIGTPQMGQIDPFLLLDEIRSSDSADYIAGFPSHPHRGFETVTYMKNGRFRHRDSGGNEGLLVDGGIQWMTAGRGIIHSETPEITEGQLWGYQLWINLPAKLKMSAPDYQDIQQDQLPEYQGQGFHVKVLAGSFEDATSPARSFYPIEYFDVNIEVRHSWLHALAENFTAVVYVYTGSVTIQGQAIETGQMAILSNGTSLEIAANTEQAGLLFISAEALREPIARHGPFVMNTPEEIQQALLDFQRGVLHV